MAERTWVFVKGHKRPVPRDPSAPFVRRFDDGAPVLATGPDDTLDAAMARHATPAAPKAKRAATPAAPNQEGE